ncbi:Iron(3+)-hydroxamate-binding protein FhuD [Neorhizobium galegae bv. orientalis]|nr:Iron(3+)-hydroxamate-binding protein FhuD [Neorhizobium galegae bv. orientalis]
MSAGFHSPTRRAFLGGTGAFAAFPFRGFASSPPRRVACLEWTAAGMVMSLGLAPIAVGDLKGYRQWVDQPTLPETTLDLGSRGEPSLELLEELNPDLIIATYGYGLEVGDFERFAPTYDLPLYAEKTSPYAQAKRETQRLGERLGREREAEALLLGTERTIDESRLRLADRKATPLCLFTFFDNRHLRIYGAGSLLQDVLDRLDLRNAWDRETGEWGISTVGVEQLATIGDVRLVCLEPIMPHAVRMMRGSSLWQNLPAVRTHPITTIPILWPFGGLDVAARFASLLADNLVSA